MRAYEIVSADGIDALHLAERPAPHPGPGEVLVRMRASSVNYRDLLTILDPESRAIPYPRIPNSDGAGEVLAIGPGVTRCRARRSRRRHVLPALGRRCDHRRGHGERARRRPGRRARRRGGARGRGPRACAGSSVVRGGGDAAVRGAHRLACADREGRAEGGRDGASARHRRGLDVRIAVRRAPRRPADRDLEQRRQAGAGTQPGRLADDQLPRDAGLGPRGPGHHRRRMASTTWSRSAAPAPSSARSRRAASPGTSR